ADVLADDLAEVDAVKVETKLAGEHFCGKGLAGAGRACEKRRRAEPALAARGPSPRVVHSPCLAHVSREVVQQIELIRGKHEIVPRRVTVDSLGETVERTPSLRARGVPKCLSPGMRRR